MSWSARIVGTAKAIKEELKRKSDAMPDDLSKRELDAARVGLDALLDCNVGNGTLLLDASGHGSERDGVITYSNCSAKIEHVGATIAVETPAGA